MKSRVGSYVLPALCKMNVALKKKLVSGIFLILNFLWVYWRRVYWVLLSILNQKNIEEYSWRKHAWSFHDQVINSPGWINSGKWLEEVMDCLISDFHCYKVRITAELSVGYISEKGRINTSKMFFSFNILLYFSSALGSSVIKCAVQMQMCLIKCLLILFREITLAALSSAEICMISGKWIKNVF